MAESKKLVAWICGIDIPINNLQNLEERLICFFISDIPWVQCGIRSSDSRTIFNSILALFYIYTSCNYSKSYCNGWNPNLIQKCSCCCSQLTLKWRSKQMEIGGDRDCVSQRVQISNSCNVSTLYAVLDYFNFYCNFGN